jgi:NDP-sugar pyrophosphorylase family protein
MAGLGSRFWGSKWSDPKPLIDLGGVRLFELVALNLLSPLVSRVVFVSQVDHHIKSFTSRLGAVCQQEFEVVEIDGLTGGPAETVLAGLDALEGDVPVVVANSDQYIFGGLSDFHEVLNLPDTAGAILLMEDSDPKWSFANLQSNGLITEVREKERISSYATIGIYGFSSGALLGELIRRMRSDGAMVNGEYYVGPSYNYVLPEEGVVRGHNLGPITGSCFGLGIPDDLGNFLSDSRGMQAVKSASIALEI